MTLDARAAGQALQAVAPELTRIWRQVRADARAGVFPGLVDGVVEPLLREAGVALDAGEDPEGTWEATAGVVRTDARDPEAAAREITVEWLILGEVLGAAFQALQVTPAARAALARALDAAKAAAPDLARGRGSHGVVVVHVLSPLAPRQRTRA
jgi:hypothetical protein